MEGQADAWAVLEQRGPQTVRPAAATGRKSEKPRCGSKPREA